MRMESEASGTELIKQLSEFASALSAYEQFGHSGALALYSLLLGLPYQESFILYGKKISVEVRTEGEQTGIWFGVQPAPAPDVARALNGEAP